MKRLSLLALAVIMSSSFVFAGSFDKDVKKYMKGDHRTEKNISRNIYRHPVKTLKFFEVKENMTVVEIWPSRGWYTEILAPALKEKGKYYAAGFSQDKDGPAWRLNINKDFQEKLTSRPDLYSEVVMTELAPPELTEIAPSGSVDRVLTFRNVHNWMKGAYADEVFSSMFVALKPGGILGVVEHRAKAGTTLEKQIKSGYVTEAQVIALAEKAGFKLLAKSEINANKKDDANHPKGVWTLPPSLRLGEEDKEKYLAIGESDRMTLKFVKPE